jgi:acetyl-CoA carboxylase biotin carboxyl carrier protein
LDLKELKEILQILEEKEITDFELEEEGMKLRIRKGPVPSANHASAPVGAPLVATVLPSLGVPVPAAAPAAAAAPASAAAVPAVPEAEAGVTVVKSPIVGTFYRTPDPNAPPFVDVGDRIRVGQVLCIIEAMKLMNEIEAEVAGEVVKVHREAAARAIRGASLQHPARPLAVRGQTAAPAMFKKILIANRGEIALRVIWACKELGVKTVAVYSEADAQGLHVRFADQAVCIGPPRNIDSYLNIPAIISAAEITGADAIHPGYGFLSESAYLAEICEACNIRFIGPGPHAIRMMGDKSRARKTMQKAGVPVIPGLARRPGGRGQGREVREGDRLPGDPQGLRGRRRTRHAGGARRRRPRALPSAPPRPRPRPLSASPTCTSSGTWTSRATSRSRSWPTPRATVVHLGERECSIQRRHQKIIEEAPSSFVTEKMRRRMGQTRWRRPGPSNTSTRGRSSSWSIPAATSTSWR